MVLWFFIWKNLNPLHPKIQMYLVLKLVQWFQRKRFLRFVNVFSLSPLGKGHGPSFEKTWIPFTKRCFVQVTILSYCWYAHREIYTGNKYSLFYNFCLFTTFGTNIFLPCTLNTNCIVGLFDPFLKAFCAEKYKMKTYSHILKTGNFETNLVVSLPGKTCVACLLLFC